MNNGKCFVFDLDGTLYRVDGEFADSPIYRQVKENIFRLLSDRLGLPREAAVAEYDRINKEYSSHISIGVEKEYGIPRLDYFNATWDIDPREYIASNPRIRELFEALQGRVAVLSNAPRVWAERVLRHFRVYDLVKGSLFTGEPDVRKPDPRAFIQVAELFGQPPGTIVSVGNEVEADILPAKRLGMKTVLVGSSSPEADVCVPSILDLIPLVESGTL